MSRFPTQMSNTFELKVHLLQMRNDRRGVVYKTAVSKYTQMKRVNHSDQVCFHHYLENKHKPLISAVLNQYIHV